MEANRLDSPSIRSIIFFTELKQHRGFTAQQRMEHRVHLCHWQRPAWDMPRVEMFRRLTILILIIFSLQAHMVFITATLYPSRSWAPLISTTVATCSPLITCLTIHPYTQWHSITGTMDIFVSTAIRLI